jgi:hypothetical protein
MEEEKVVGEKENETGARKGKKGDWEDDGDDGMKEEDEEFEDIPNPASTPTPIPTLSIFSVPTPIPTLIISSTPFSEVLLLKGTCK